MGGTHIVYAVTLHSHTLSHILQQCARYYPAILFSRKLSFLVFLGCSCLALFAIAAAVLAAETQCHLLLFLRAILRSQPDQPCVITCVFTRAGPLGLPGTTVQQTLEPCPVVEQRCSIDGAPDFLIRRGAQDALPTDCHCTEMMYMIHHQSTRGLKK